MRFYVPEWDDAVDAHYDFVHDELSTLDKSNRERDFIWDIFDKETTPIDGVLISREQVGDSQSKYERLTKYGVYNDPELSVPDWLPTISDCGAWGYKGLPFPPYSNREMLEFYESLDVDVGVSIDHLVLGSGKEQGRLYLDERAFGDDFTIDELPERLVENVDIMSDEWPASWPKFVEKYEPSIRDQSSVQPFQEDDFRGPVQAIIERLSDDPRAVYREDDKQFRYDLTLNNAREMRELYEADDWSFRLMAAFQGWDPKTYADAVSEILDAGYQYVGIGGVAGSPVGQVRDIVSEVGAVVTDYERTHETRIDAHVFGFAKVDAFDTVGRSGMTSFDSASMLRAAWTGGKNYHLNSDERYDAIRVRYPQPGDPLDESVEKALRAQEVLHALRAYDRGDSIATAIQQWHETASVALNSLPEFLREHRHDDHYNRSRLRDVRSELREHFEYGRPAYASFGQDFRREIVGLLRDDSEDSPIEFERYEDIIRTAHDVFDSFPRMADQVAELEQDSETGTFRQAWQVVEDYADSKLIEDADLLDDYRRTLRARPWERCRCPICEELGIEVAIFRGNNRNRRRGFHNTRRFYDQFEQELPKIFAVVPAGSGFYGQKRVEEYLKSEYGEFWATVHDLPVIDIGVCDAGGIHEWWETMPDGVSLDPDGIDEVLNEKAARYDSILVFDESGKVSSDHTPDVVHTTECLDDVRKKVLTRLGYGEEYSPADNIQIGLGEF